MINGNSNNIDYSTIKKLKKPQLVGFLEIILIVFAIFGKSVTTNSICYSMDLSPNNHTYPIFNILRVKLNNATNAELVASVKIYNTTSKTWELNNKFLEYINGELSKLSNIDNNLINITIYSINDMVLPGTLYLLLTTKGYKIAENVTIQTIIPYLESSWYVDSLSFPLLDLYEFDFDHPGDFRWLGISAETGFGIIFVSTGFDWWFKEEPNFQYNQSRYSLIYQTNETRYYARTHEGIIASPWLWNGTVWITNEDFQNILYRDVSIVNNSLKTIMQINNISLLCLLTDINSMQNRTGSLIDPLRNILYIQYRIVFDLSLPRDEQLHLYFLIYAILSNYWYTENTIKTYLVQQDSITRSSFAFIFSLIAFIPISSFRYAKPSKAQSRYK